MRRVVLGLSVVLMLTGVALGSARVVALEGAELEQITDPVPVVPESGARRILTEVQLDAGETISIEVCDAEGFPPERWADAVAFEVRPRDEDALLVSTPMDRDELAQLHRSPLGACVRVAQGQDLPTTAAFHVLSAFADGASPEALASARVQVRTVAYTPLSVDDPWPVWLGLLGALLFVLSFVVPASRPSELEAAAADLLAEPEPEPRPSAPAAPPRRPMSPTVAVAIGLAVFVAGQLATALIPIGGATGGLVRGGLFAVVQVGVALALLRFGGQALGFDVPKRAIAWFLAAPVVGLVLRAAGGILSRLVPSTGEAPIEALVFWPSGALAVAVVAVLVPIAEEIFFRGLVYGGLERRFGANASLALTTLVFAAAHVPQVWGAWGALASITLTGLVLTALRRASGSTLVPILAHLAHNGVISILALT